MTSSIFLRAISLLLAVAPFLPGLTHAQDASAPDPDPVAALEAVYLAELEESSHPLRSLDAKYLEQLERLKQELVDAGDLQGVLAVQKEIEGFAADTPRDFSVQPKLARLRAIYEEARERLKQGALAQQAPVHRDWAEKFAELKRQLTQQNQLEAALRVEELEKQALAAAASGVAATQAMPQASSPAADLEAQETLLWELGREADYESVGVDVDRRGGRWILTSKQDFRSQLQTDEEFELPIVIKTRAGTDASSMRFYFNSEVLVLFNWEVTPDALRIHPPLKTPVVVPGTGLLEHDQLYDIEIHVMESGVRVVVDGEERGEAQVEIGPLKGTIGLGPATGSTITVESLEVHRGLQMAEPSPRNP